MRRFPLVVFLTALLAIGSALPGSAAAQDYTGTGKKILTRHLDAARDMRPWDWSPDGTRILFNRTVLVGFDNIGELWVMDSDGSNKVRLSDANVRLAFWTPDGSKILFMVPAGSPGAGPNVFTMNADGTGVAPVTLGQESHSDPMWSPDGAEVALVHRPSGCFPNVCPSNLVVVRLATGAERQIATDVVGPVYWSPDGSLIAYGCNLQNGALRICVSDPYGLSETELVSSALAYASSPVTSANSDVWSPDSSQLLVQCNIVFGDPIGLCRVSRDGSEFQFMGRFFEPDWSPDGSMIAAAGPVDPVFGQSHDNHSDVFVLGADGLGVSNITNSQGHDLGPRWAPDGETVALGTGRVRVSGDVLTLVVHQPGA